MPHGLGHTLSDVSELSEFPEEHEHAGVNGRLDALRSPPLQIISSQRVLAPLERRSKVLARELEAEAEASSPQAVLSANGLKMTTPAPRPSMWR